MHICYTSYYIGIHAAMQWKDIPRDLDLHLFSFDSKTLNLVTHCYFGNRGGDNVGVGLEHGERLHLDRDDTQVCRMQSFCPWCVALQISISLDTVCNFFLTRCSLICREMEPRP